MIRPRQIFRGYKTADILNEPLKCESFVSMSSRWAAEEWKGFMEKSIFLAIALS